VRFSIRTGSATGPVQYAEVHTTVTTAQGLFTLVIGKGTPQTATFAGIDWRTANHFLQTEIDPAGGNNFISIGTTPFTVYPLHYMPPIIRQVRRDLKAWLDRKAYKVYKEPFGPIGATGPQGPIGNTGAQGAQGPAGASGASGPSAWWQEATRAPILLLISSAPRMHSHW